MTHTIILSLSIESRIVKKCLIIITIELIMTFLMIFFSSILSHKLVIQLFYLYYSLVVFVVLVLRSLRYQLVWLCLKSMVPSFLFLMINLLGIVDHNIFRRCSNIRKKYFLLPQFIPHTLFYIPYRFLSSIGSRIRN